LNSLTITLAPLLLLACGADVTSSGKRADAIVYGPDGRAEYFESSPDVQSRMSESVVALVPRSQLHPRTGKVMVESASLGNVVGLCPGEPFADEPAAAFCTGVLVDWDLVLTAGHCLRLFALEDFAVVFDYAYRDSGRLDVRTDAVVDPVAIVSEALDPSGAEPRLDYGFIRLAGPVAPPRRPAPVYVRTSPLALGEPLVSIGSGGGVPLKVDEGGTVTDLRETIGDYFFADTDTVGGASGGGAFDSTLALAGILARGGADWVDTAEGCRTTAKAETGATAQEQFTYSNRAVERLCEEGEAVSSLCRADCGEPCAARPRVEPAREDGGCAIGPSWGSRRSSAGLFPILLCVAVRCRRWDTRGNAKCTKDTKPGGHHRARPSGPNGQVGVVGAASVPERLHRASAVRRFRYSANVPILRTLFGVSRTSGMAGAARRISSIRAIAQ
jgi:hypothetical protein